LLPLEEEDEVDDDEVDDELVEEDSFDDDGDEELDEESLLFADPFAPALARLSVR
jgi:hypothetical protein